MELREGQYAFPCSGERVDVRDLPTKPDVIDEEEGRELTDALGKELDGLQELLYAAGTEALLVVLQGMDTSGKDGTIRRVFRDMDPQGVRVASFKVPTPLELHHDFLWRVHMATPELGMVVVFNRSHYEAVLVERVKGLVPEGVWRPRYAQIRDFEQLLVQSGTLVLKFFLHISKAEQEERLLERQQDVEKAWKLNSGDWVDRQYWDAYQDAYSDAISRTGTEYAPWWVIPADRKWYRDLAVSQVLVQALRPHRERWLASLREVGERQLAEIAKVRVEIADGTVAPVPAAPPEPTCSEPAAAPAATGGEKGKSGKKKGKKDD